MYIITSVLGGIVMRVDTGGFQGLSVEDYGIAFEDRSVDYLMLNRHYLQREHYNAVAAVNSNERVVIRTLYSQD